MPPTQWIQGRRRLYRGRHWAFPEGSPGGRADAGRWPLNIAALEASGQIAVTVLEVRSGRMSTRSLNTIVRVEPVLAPFDDGGVNAMLPLGEAHLQSARTSLTQVYYNLAMELARALETLPWVQ